MFGILGRNLEVITGAPFLHRDEKRFFHREPCSSPGHKEWSRTQAWPSQFEAMIRREESFTDLQIARESCGTASAGRPRASIFSGFVAKKSGNGFATAVRNSHGRVGCAKVQASAPEQTQEPRKGK